MAKDHTFPLFFFWNPSLKERLPCSSIYLFVQFQQTWAELISGNLTCRLQTKVIRGTGRVLGGTGGPNQANLEA